MLSYIAGTKPFVFYVEEVMLAEENKNAGTSALEGKEDRQLCC